MRSRSSTRIVTESMIKLLRILRDSLVWIPCNVIMSDADNAAMEKMLAEAEESESGLKSLVGKTITNQDCIRMVPDILQNENDFFFPVFTSAEEMGDYGETFSKVEKHFLEAANLARNNEKNVAGIVINAFTESIVIPKDLFDIIAGMPSSIEPADTSEE